MFPDRRENRIKTGGSRSCGGKTRCWRVIRLLLGDVAIAITVTLAMARRNGHDEQRSAEQAARGSQDRRSGWLAGWLAGSAPCCNFSYFVEYFYMHANRLAEFVANVKLIITTL